MFHAQIIKVLLFGMKADSPTLSGPENLKHETEMTKKGKTNPHFLQ